VRLHKNAPQAVGGILSAHLLEALLGFVPEMLEIGAERKRP